MRRISIGKRAKRDSPLRKEITESWEKWLEGLPDEVSVPRSITHQKQNFIIHTNWSYQAYGLRNNRRHWIQVKSIRVEENQEQRKRERLRRSER